MNENLNERRHFVLVLCAHEADSGCVRERERLAIRKVRQAVDLKYFYLFIKS